MALVSSLFASVAAAQQETVPMEFVRLLLLHDAVGAGRQGEIRVGQLPEWLPSIPGARPVGTVDHDWLSLSAFVAPGAEPEARLRRALIAAGWTPAPASPFASTGGFVAADQGPAGTEDTVLCGPGGRSVQLGGKPHAGDSSAVVVISTRAVGVMQGGSQCLPQAGQPAESMRERQEWQAPMPVLDAPPGATQRRGGSSSGSGEARAHAQLTTTMTARDIVAHYAEQMVTAGWTAGALAFAGQVAIQTFEKAEDGVRWTATLTVVATADGERRVRLDVERSR